MMCQLGGRPTSRCQCRSHGWYKLSAPISSFRATCGPDDLRVSCEVIVFFSFISLAKKDWKRNRRACIVLEAGRNENCPASCKIMMCSRWLWTRGGVRRGGERCSQAREENEQEKERNDRPARTDEACTYTGVVCREYYRRRAWRECEASDKRERERLASYIRVIHSSEGDRTAAASRTAVVFTND